jgi:polyhydroxyalkanoate synthesis regulator protein
MRLKRYRNRSLFDVDAQTWVNLDDVRDAVVREEPVEVTDSNSGADQTGLVLTSILMAEAQKGRVRHPDHLLTLIRMESEQEELVSKVARLRKMLKPKRR